MTASSLTSAFSELSTSQIALGAVATAAAALTLRRLVLREQGPSSPPSSRWEDHVLPHDRQLTEIVPDELWVLQGTLPPPMKLPRCMTLFRPPHSGDLWVHSPIAVDESMLADILKLGQVRFIVVPSSWHRLDAGVWASRFPDASVVSPKDHVKAVETEVGHEIDGDCETTLSEWGIAERREAHVDPFHLPGVGELAYKLNLSKGHALVVCDTFFHIEEKLGFIPDRLLGSTGFFGVSRIGRLALWARGKRKEFGEALLRLSQNTPWRAITVAHGKPILSECNALLADVAQNRWLQCPPR